jgi:hypothetical protein
LVDEEVEEEQREQEIGCFGLGWVGKKKVKKEYLY